MFPQAKKIKGQLPLNEQGDQKTCLLSMTPTRLALLSPAAGSRQCRASTDLGRGPHVSSSLHLHLPISPLPTSSPYSALSRAVSLSIPPPGLVLPPVPLALPPFAFILLSPPLQPPLSSPSPLLSSPLPPAPPLGSPSRRAAPP